MRTICITLRQDPRKESAAREHFVARNVHAEFFYGIHGVQWGLRTAHLYHQDDPNTDYSIGPKHIGMVLSHFMLWNALLYLPNKQFMILEDDCRFSEDWQTRHDEALAALPETWDMLYFGNCCCDNTEKTEIASGLFRVNYVLCTHAYAVSRKGLKILIELCNKAFAPVDIMIQLLARQSLETYAVLPRICYQENTDLAP